MNYIERVYKICQILQKARYPVKAQTLCDQLGVKRATIMRDLDLLRDRFNAPILSSRNPGGFYFDPAAPRFELPGLWFSADEAQALVTLCHLIHNMEPGVLEPYLKPAEERIGELLADRDNTLHEVRRRIRVLALARRDHKPEHFELITHALLDRLQLEIEHYNRGRDELTQRQISPQRLVYYRDNWYLDAFDHLRDGLRTFSLDTLRKVNVSVKKARNVADSQLDKVLGSSYGIFSGDPIGEAVLVFTAYRARWVSREVWHPDQQSHFRDDGSYELRIPYSDDRELLMDILKYGADVEVISPESLRARVRTMVDLVLKKYS